MSLPKKYKRKGDNRAGAHHLFMVCGVNEAARLFNVTPGTIRYHIYNDNIAYRRVDGLYVVSTLSLIAYYKRTPPALSFLKK